MDASEFVELYNAIARLYVTKRKPRDGIAMSPAIVESLFADVATDFKTAWARLGTDPEFRTQVQRRAGRHLRRDRSRKTTGT